MKFIPVILFCGFCLLVGLGANGPGLDDVAMRGEPTVYLAKDIQSIETGEVPYYVHKAEKALAINAAKPEYRGKFARAEVTHQGEAGRYDLTLTTLTEVDGECTYRLLINGKKIGSFQNPPTKVDYKPATHTWRNVAIKTGDKIQVESNSHSNDKIPEGDSFAWARGRWTQLVVAQVKAEERD